MKGLQIVIHSVRLVFNNLDAALKISLLPYAISGLAYLYFDVASMNASGQDPAMVTAMLEDGVLGKIFAYVLISGVMGLWIAVAWHRYVLLEEYPTSWVPKFHAGAVLSYLGKGILIILLIMVVALVVGLGAGLLVGWMGPVGAGLTGLLSIAAATYLFYRLCPVLPSAAIGEKMKFGEAFDYTQNSTGTIAVLVLVVLIASTMLNLPTTLGAGDSVFGIAYSLILSWISTLVGVSILTTFYGHFVQGRDID